MRKYEFSVGVEPLHLGDLGEVESECLEDIGLWQRLR